MGVPMYQTDADRLAADVKRLAVTESTEEQNARLKELRADDPISYQDAKITSSAFLQAVKDEDLEETKRIVKDAYPEDCWLEHDCRGVFCPSRRRNVFDIGFHNETLTKHRLWNARTDRSRRVVKDTLYYSKCFC